MFKLVSCKPGASRVRELAVWLGPQGLRSSKCSKICISGNMSKQLLAPGGLSAGCVMF